MHNGACFGADQEAWELADLRVWRFIFWPSNVEQAQWAVDVLRPQDTRMVTLPPLERNHRMVDDCIALLAAPSSRREELRSGTWATVRYARKCKVRRYMAWPDGSITEEAI
jgi:hypothetical protein